MKYPKLEDTPIKEIIFSISYGEIVDKNCFENFVNLDFIKNHFEEKKPTVTNEFQITANGVNVLKDNSGFHLKKENEILQMRKGSLSYHQINEYRDYEDMLLSLIKYWEHFQLITTDSLTITDISVRYINYFEINEFNSVSELIQLYPKQSKGRDISNFQNSITFSYSDSPQYKINAVSTQPQSSFALLDINVNKKTNNKTDLASEFKPLREIKNRVFFDSITAKALLKYINQKK